MNRRQFLHAGAVMGAAAVGSSALGCGATLPRPTVIAPTPIDSFLATGARVMWVAAHPDDECFSGAILARASIHYGNPLYLLVLTHGDGGECCIPEGCHPDLATVRGLEMRAVAARYRAILQHEHFWNAPLPVSSFPKRHEIYARWRRQRDPVQVVADAVRRFRPDVVFTFSPVNGATGHPEHQLASRLATAGIRRAAQGDGGASGAAPGSAPASQTARAAHGAPHRVKRTYYVLNRFWLYRLFGRADPGPVSERFDATLPCRPGLSCLSFMTEATKLHRTQNNDMSRVRSIRSVFARMDLRLVDPYHEIRPPDEPA